MVKRTSSVFRNKVYAKTSPPRKSYDTNNTDVFYVDETWSMVRLNLNDYDPKNNEGY